MSNHVSSNGGESGKSIQSGKSSYSGKSHYSHSSILTMSTKYPLRMPKTNGALTSTKEVMSLPPLLSSPTMPPVDSDSDLDDDEMGENDYFINARQALELSSRQTTARATGLPSRKESLLSSPSIATISQRHGVDDTDQYQENDNEIFRSSLLRSLAADPPATIIDNTPTKILTKREMDALRAQFAENQAVDQVGCCGCGCCRCCCCLCCCCLPFIVACTYSSLHLVPFHITKRH